MTKYGSFKYGTSETYGASAVTEGGILTWVLSVDWDDDGIFEGDNEADRMLSIRIRGGREHYLSTGGSGFDHMRPATCTITLDNYDRRYDPRNSGGALYPNVKRGHKMQVRVRDNANNTFYTVFTGILDDIRGIFTKGGGDVTFECVGHLQQLFDTELTASAARINTTINGALVALLDDVQYPGQIVLDAETQPVISFGPVDQKAGDVAMDLADAALGTFFVDRTGRARFYSRSHSSWTTHNIAQSQIGIEIETTQPWDAQFNEVRVTSYNQIYKQGSVIYYLPTPVKVTSGTPVTLYPKYPPSRDVQLVTVEGNSDKDGNGSDISSNLAYTSSLGIAGGSVTVTPSANGYITNVEIRGRAFDACPEEFSETDTTNPASTFGLKRFKLDTHYLQDRNYASEFVGFLGSDNDFLYGDREAFVVTITSRPDLQFGIELLDKVSLTAAYLDLSSEEFYVLGYQIESGQNMQDITTTLYLDTILIDDTAVTAADIETAQQQAPTGYQNPAGDSETMGSDPALPTYSQMLTLYGTATPTSGGWSDTITWSSEYEDTNNLITTPGTTITIPVDGAGYYVINLKSQITLNHTYSADGDAIGLAYATSSIQLKVNSATIQNNKSGSSNLRFGKAAPYWVAFLRPEVTYGVKLEDGDTLTAVLSMVTTVTAFSSASAVCWLTMFRV